MLISILGKGERDHMTEIIISVLDFFKGLVLSMPDLSMDTGQLSQIVTALDKVVEFIAKVNFLVPIDHILLLISLVYGFKLVKFSVFAINWVIRRIADIIP